MSQERLTYTNAAEVVLTRHSKGAPMHYRRIAELAVSEDLIKPGDTTPEASMVASITQEVSRQPLDQHRRGRLSATHGSVS